MSVSDNYVDAVATALGVASLVWSAVLLPWALLDVLGRRADRAVDGFILRVGTSGWGSLIMFPLIVNVGSSVFVAGVVSAVAAIRHGDGPWLGYGLAIGGLLFAVGVPVWASKETKDPDRRAIAPQIYELRHEFQASGRAAALASIARERSKVDALTDRTYSLRFWLHVVGLSLGPVSCGVAAISLHEAAWWTNAALLLLLVITALIVRGPIRARSLRTTAAALSDYEIEVCAMTAPAPDPPAVHHHYHQTGNRGWAFAGGIMTAVILGNVLGRRRL